MDADSASGVLVPLDSDKRCRLCWGEDDDNATPLIVPCKCNGSMKYIHRACLQHWLDTNREQGYRRKTFRCEVCRAQYDLAVVDGRDAATKAAQRIQYTLSDPYYWASCLHGAWRVYVATTGVKLAISQYSVVSRSIQQINRGLDQASLVNYMRLKFDRATMVQVYWYTALMAILPQPPNLDAFGGMAVGSVIGGMLAQVMFLPLMGVNPLSALGSSLNLATRCAGRLLAAHFCCSWGHRLLISACKGAARLIHRPPAAVAEAQAPPGAGGRLPAQPAAAAAAANIAAARG